MNPKGAEAGCGCAAVAPRPLPAPQYAGKPAADAPRGEVGGPKGPEPTRFGDWERNGRCIDF
jgi:hypothetical protein